MKRFVIAILASVLALVFSGRGICDDVPASGVEGRVALHGQVLPGVHVYAYAGFSDMLSNSPAAVSGPTGDDGSFRLPLAQGRYYLVAKRRAAGESDGPMSPGDLYSFHGSNPVTVPDAGFAHVGFSLVEYTGQGEYTEGQDAGAGSLTGTVTYMGQPVSGAYVSIYVDPGSDFRGMAFSSPPPTRESGRFAVDFLPEADYYVIARKRASGKPSGPLTEGDYFGYYAGNPVKVKAGKSLDINFEIISKAGEIGKDDSLFRETGTRITGKITDKDGKPVSGVYAFAYTDKVMAHKRPEFMSREVAEDGSYVINLSEGGVYYVGARSDYGDSPGMGEWYGRYDVTPDHSVKVETGGEAKDIDITVERILP